VASLENAGAGAFLKTLTIVGGGWAGLAAAVHAVNSGWKVKLYEAASQLGGRARGVVRDGLLLDNGQHILIGAYTHTLSLMQTVGVDIESYLLRMPLAVKYADGSGLQLQPGLPTPLNVIAGILSAKGWPWPDKWRFLRQAWQWQRQHFVCASDLSVSDICGGVPRSIMDQLIEPLCVSALNMPCNKANAQIFLKVIEDGLMGNAGCSDMLIPRTDLSMLFPVKAKDWLTRHGAEIVTNQRVTDLHFDEPSTVVLACPAWEAARLVRHLNPNWASLAEDLQHTSIATVYLRTHKTLNWPLPIMALKNSADAPAQFAFDKYRISQQAEMLGVIAMVVSHCNGDKETLTQAVLQQAHEQLGLESVEVLLTIVEKRAAFECPPHLVRPSMYVHEGVWACGDYVAGPYPSTLEAAVRSGEQAMAFLNNSLIDENNI